MRTFLIAWDPATSEYTDEWFTAAMRTLEWGDLYMGFPKKPSAQSGDNFYLVRRGTSRDGIVAKGFFLSNPYCKNRSEQNPFRMDIQPTFMVQWCHEKGILELDKIREAIPEFPVLEDRWCTELPEDGVKKLSAIWSYYISRFEEEDYLDCLLEKSERPAAGIDEAVSMASDALFDEEDSNGEPLILKALATGLAGKTEDEKICGFLLYVFDCEEGTPGRLRKAGFQEKIVDALSILNGPDRPNSQERVRGLVESGNALAVSVKINDLRCRLKSVGEGDSLVKYQQDSAALDYLLESTR